MKRALSKKLKILLLSLTLIAMAFAVVFAMPKTEKVSAAIGTAGWTKQGSATVGTITNGYYPISGLLETSTRASRAGYNEKLTVDGLVVSFYVDNWSDGPIGFGFGDTIGAFPPDVGSYFCAHFRKSTDWDFLYYTTGFAFDDSLSIAYKDSALTNHGYGIDSVPRYAFNESGGETTTIGVSIKFEKSGSVWKITTSSISNKGTMGRREQDYCYVAASKIPDQAYVIAWGEMKNSPVANYRIGEEAPAVTGWTKNGGNISLSNSSSGVEVTAAAGWGGYVVSDSTFKVDNFETTIKLKSYPNPSDGWFLFGLEKNKKGFNSAMSPATISQDLGLFFLINCPSTSSKFFEISCFFFRPGATEMYMTGTNKGMTVPVKDMTLEFRMYPDVYNKYIQIEINGVLLHSDRLKFETAKSIFGNDLKGYYLLQTGCSSGSYAMTMTKINNKLATASDITTVDPNNIPKYDPVNPDWITEPSGKEVPMNTEVPSGLNDSAWDVFETERINIVSEEDKTVNPSELAEASKGCSGGITESAIIVSIVAITVATAVLIIRKKKTDK